MLDINYGCSTRIIMSPQAELETAVWVRSYGGTAVLLHHDSGYIKECGVIERIKKILESDGLKVVELGGVVPNPHLGLVREGIELCRKERVDFILAVGGGSVIDSAKAIAAGVPYEGDVWDFYAEENGQPEVVPQKALSIGVVLTMAATGSESSNGTVITKEDEKLKRSFDNDVIRPCFAIENPNLTMTLPDFQTFCGLVDIMSHSMERYFTRKGTENELTDRFCEAVFGTCITSARALMKNRNDYDARANLMLVSGFSHNGLTGIGRTGDWASHHIAHELSGMFNVTHGAALAIILPAWMKYTYKENRDIFYKWAVRVMEVSPKDSIDATILEGIEAFENFVTEIGVPVRLSQSKQVCVEDLTDDMLRGIAKQVRKVNGDGTVGCVKPLDEKDIFEVLKLAI